MQSPSRSPDSSTPALPEAVEGLKQDMGVMCKSKVVCTVEIESELCFKTEERSGEGEGGREERRSAEA